MRSPRVLVLAALLALAALGIGPISTIATPPSLDPLQPEPASVYRFLLDERGVDRLLAHDVDLTHNIHQTTGGFEVDVVLTPSELTALVLDGLQPTDVLMTPRDVVARLAERDAALAREQRALELVQLGNDVLRVIRADYYSGRTGDFVSVEAYHEAGDLPTDILNVVAYGSSGEPVGTFQLSRFSDAGQYLYHRGAGQVSGPAVSVDVFSNLGQGYASAEVKEWVGEEHAPEPTYLQDFITGYMDPTQLYDRIEQLHAAYPDITEIIELPYETRGYAREARAVHGSTAASQVLVISEAMGHEGGNDITVDFVVPTAAGQPLSVTTDGSAITVSLATDAAGLAASTAAEVAGAPTGQAGELVTAHTYRGNAGSGTVEPGAIQLSDDLQAPDSVARGPFTVRALRVNSALGGGGGTEPEVCERPGRAPVDPQGWCEKRPKKDAEDEATSEVSTTDEDRVGVLIYSQEHAREWVTPLVALEAAERLVRNYGTDPNTTSLVDTLDIFIIPSVNPDGSHYSLYDFNSQRKNMTNYCGPENSDPGRADSWGVDLNRNFSVGSRFDGYSGASSSCTSSTYSGPSELSEPEARNEVWLTEEFPNIRFAMNTHSYGNYFMWPPGAYRTDIPEDPRQTLERPTFGEELYFWEAGEHILEHVRTHRDTVVTPARTGPVLDVLYSAAGNSADEHWYNRRIFGWDFEVGDIGFQPAFSPSGHAEAMEFASGIIGLLEVARDYANDATAPTSEASVTDDGDVRYVTFTTSEPATVYYTLDGSEPTTDSAVYEQLRMRELVGEPVEVPAGATLRWFSVDARGNAEPVQTLDTA